MKVRQIALLIATLMTTDCLVAADKTAQASSKSAGPVKVVKSNKNSPKDKKSVRVTRPARASLAPKDVKPTKPRPQVFPRDQWQRELESARNSLQRDLNEHANKLRAQTQFLDQQEKLVEQQSKMLEQQSRMIDQQTHLFEQQGRMLDQQNTVLVTQVNRLTFISLLILGVGLVVWIITLVIGWLGLGALKKSTQVKGHAIDAGLVWDDDPGRLHRLIQKMTDGMARRRKSSNDIADEGSHWRKVRDLWSKVRGREGSPSEFEPSPGSPESRQQQTEDGEIDFRLSHARALEAYLDGDKTLAAEYWVKAASSGEADPVQEASAIFNAAVLSEGNDAIRLYDAILDRFGEATDLTLQEWVAKSLINKSAILDKLGRHQEGLLVDEEVIRRFGDSRDLSLQERVAKALLNRGVTLDLLGHHEEALLAYREVVDRFEAAPQPALSERVARALVYIGDTLDSLGRHEEGLYAYDEVISRYGAAVEPSLISRVAIARNNKGCCLINWSREKWSDKDSRLQILADAKECFSQALIDFEDKPLVSANLAYATFLLRSDEHPTQMMATRFRRRR